MNLFSLTSLNSIDRSFFVADLLLQLHLSLFHSNRCEMCRKQSKPEGPGMKKGVFAKLSFVASPQVASAAVFLQQFLVLF